MKYIGIWKTEKYVYVKDDYGNDACFARCSVKEALRQFKAMHGYNSMRNISVIDYSQNQLPDFTA